MWRSLAERDVRCLGSMPGLRSINNGAVCLVNV